MTPEERANKVRIAYRDAAARHPHDGDISALLPEGSMILTPDEAAFCLEELKWRQHWGDCARGPSGPISVSYPENECDCRWGKAKRLLGGAA